MEKKSSINERILYIVDNKFNGNVKKFSEKIGFSPQAIHNIVSGKRSKPGYEVLSSVIINVENINANWLLTGEGEMFKKGETPPMQTEEPATAHATAPSFVGEFLSMIREKDTQIQTLLVENAELKAENKHLREQHRTKDHDAG